MKAKKHSESFINTWLSNKYPQLENITVRKGIVDRRDVEYFIKKHYQTNWNLMTEELERVFDLRMSGSSKLLDRFLGYNV